MEVIQPDSTQKEVVNDILMKHHQKMIEFGRKSMDRLKIHSDSLLIEMEPVLKPDQLDRLKKRLMEKPPRPGKPGKKFDRRRPKD
jgi:hypothetical protein